MADLPLVSKILTLRKIGNSPNLGVDFRRIGDRRQLSYLGEMLTEYFYKRRLFVRSESFLE